MEAKTRVTLTEKDIVQMLRDAGFTVPDNVRIFTEQYDCSSDVELPILVEFPTTK
jgi:hypothetical protein